MVIFLALMLPAGARAAPRLRVAPSSAVPGQVVELRGNHVGRKGARVTVAGHKAAIVRRSANRVRVIVPAVGRGRRRIVVRTGQRSLTARLRIGKGFNGKVKPKLDPRRAATRTIGPAGGTVAARGSDGTRYELLVPAGALNKETPITLTPLRSLGGAPLGGRPVGVQLSPNGLVFVKAATLKLTLRHRIVRKAVAFDYSGKGGGFVLERSRRAGRTLTFAIEHFSGAGSGTITVDSFLRLVARLLIGELTLADVDEFLHDLGAVQAIFGDFCLTEATCYELLRRSTEVLTREARAFSCGSKSSGKNLDLLRLGLRIEGDLEYVDEGGQARSVARERECITNSLVTAAEDPAREDPLGTSSQANGASAADRSRADIDGDDVVTNLEWALFLAGVASQQGFSALQARAISAFEAGLRSTLDAGIAKCEQSFPEGANFLAKGQTLAKAATILVPEFADALANCKPKIFITPPSASLEIGHTQTFSARSNDGDSAFDWKADDGSIDSSGKLTAPGTPGTLIVTAISRFRTPLTAQARVTVTCPAGQVEFQGECRTISVTVAPQSPLVAPGEEKQFTATVLNTANQGVTWTASGGSISQGGLFTAPQQAGGVTITARSKQDTTKTGTTTVTVAHPGVNVLFRGSEMSFVNTTANVLGVSGGNCPRPGAVFSHQFAKREGEPSPLGLWESGPLASSAEATPLSCGASSADAIADLISSTSQDVESADGDLTLSYEALDSHAVTMHRTGTELENRVVTAAYGVLSVTLDVVGEPVTLSCSTTLTGDPRAGTTLENEEQLFQLRVFQGNAMLWDLHDTTPETEIALQPGRYLLSVENKTYRWRENTTEDDAFFFGAEADCLRVA